MKKSKFAEKVVSKIEKELKNRGISDDYIIDSDVKEVSSVKHPFFLIEYPNGEEFSYDIYEEYVKHEEQDISITESISGFITKVFDDIENHMHLSTFDEEEFENEEEEEEEEDEDIDDLDEYDDDEEDVNEDAIPFLSHLSIEFINPEKVSYFRSELSRAVIPVYMSVKRDNTDESTPTLFFTIKNELTKAFISSDSPMVPNYTESLINNIKQKDFEITRVDNFLSMSSEALFSRNALEKIKDELGTSKFYIVPSSVNTLLFVPMDRMSLEAITDCLHTINSTLGDKKLSDSIYVYDFGEHEFFVANDEIVEEMNRNPENQIEHEESPFVRPSLSPEHQHQENASNNNGERAEDSTDSFSMEELRQIFDEAFSEVMNEHLTNSDEELCAVDANYFANYDTDYESEFAEKMAELFDWRLGTNFNVQNMMLCNSENSVQIDLRVANNEYQNNSLDFLEFGDKLIDRYLALEKEAIKEAESNKSSEEDMDYDDPLPFY